MFKINIPTVFVTVASGIMFLFPVQINAANPLQNGSNDSDTDRGKEESLKLLYDRASLEAKEGNFKSARQVLMDAVECYPDNPEVHYRLAMVYMQLDELLKAIQCLEKAIELGASDANLYYVYASVCVQYGEFDKGKDAYMHAIKKNPRMINAYHDLGLLYSRMGDHEKAIEMFEVALSIKKELPKTMLALGMTYVRVGKPENAVEYVTDLRLLKEEAKASILENLIRGSSRAQELLPEPDAKNLVPDPQPPMTASQGQGVNYQGAAAPISAPNPQRRTRITGKAQINLKAES